MRDKKPLLLLFATTFIIVCHGQKGSSIDSLLTDLKLQKDDTGKVNTLNALSKQYLLMKNISYAKEYAEDALFLAEKKDFKKGINGADTNLINVFYKEGNAFYYEGNFPEALKKYLTCLNISEKIGDKLRIATFYRNVGLVFWKQGNYSEALKNYFISLKKYEEIGDKKRIAAAYNDVGNAYENQGNYADALKNYLISLKKYEELGDKASMINRFFNIGFLYEDQGNYPEALKNYSFALKLCEEIASKEGIAASYSNIGGAYYQQGKALTGYKQSEKLYNEALKNYLISLKSYEESGDMEGLAVCYNGIGGTYIELKNFSKANQFLNDGLSLFKKVKNEENSGEHYQMPAAYIRENYQLLARVDSATGNWEGAFNNYWLYIYYRDSLMNEENTSKSTRIQMQYDFDKKEDSLKYQQTRTNEKLQQQTLLTHQQRLIKNYLIAGLVLFAVLSFFVYRNYQTRQQLKLQTLRNKIASDLHDDVGSTLSSISIFSQMAQQQSKEVIPLLETIEESSRKMLDAMADIVWTIKPENDQFEKIISRMRSFAYELLGARKIDFEFVADDDVAKMKLPMEVRKNLYLIFKEATNNMVKYANADKAMFAISEEKNNLTMLIRDNGKGFDTSQPTTGNGLKNMKKRADEIKGQLLIESSPGFGTTIQLNIAM